MQSQPFFNTISGIAVSLAGFASLIAALRDDPRAWDPINLWRVKTIVRDALTIAALGLALSPIFTLTTSETGTIRIGSGLIVVFVIADMVLHMNPDPVIWDPPQSWKVFMAGNAVYLALLGANLAWASLGVLQAGFLLLLGSPAGIFYNFVRELGREPGPEDVDRQPAGPST